MEKKISTKKNYLKKPKILRKNLERNSTFIFRFKLDCESFQSA